MIGIKMLVSSNEHSWAADEKRVSQQVDQRFTAQQHILGDKSEAAGQQFRFFNKQLSCPTVPTHTICKVPLKMLHNTILIRINIFHMKSLAKSSLGWASLKVKLSVFLVKYWIVITLSSISLVQDVVCWQSV